MIRREDGVSLVELMLAMALMLGVMAATLTVLDRVTVVGKRTERLSDTIDRARLAMDRLTRDMRGATGHGAGTLPSGAVLLRATGGDLVFRHIDARGSSTTQNKHAVQTVRWCLDAPQRRLVRQVTPGIVVPAAACPAAGWTTQIVAADVNNGDRPVFGYDATDLGEITSVSTALAIDADPVRVPSETHLSSGTFLRNQNRRPTASFSAVSTSGRSVQLNGSTSVDPEGGLLTYTWSDGSTALAATGPVVSYVAPAAGPRSFTLTVTDPGGLSATITSTVVVRQ